MCVSRRARRCQIVHIRAAWPPSCVRVSRSCDPHILLLQQERARHRLSRFASPQGNAKAARSGRRPRNSCLQAR